MAEFGQPSSWEEDPDLINLMREDNDAWTAEDDDAWTAEDDDALTAEDDDAWTAAYEHDSTNHGEQYNSQRPTGLHNGSTGAMHEPLNGSEQNMPPPAPTQTLSTGQQSEPERQTTLVPPNPYAGPSQPAPSVGPSRPGFIEIPTWSYSRIQSHEIRIKYGDLSVLNRYQFDEYQAFRAWRAEFTGWDPTTRGPFPYHPPQEMVNGRQHIQEDLLPRADMFQFGNGVPGMPMPPPTLPPGWQVNYHGNGSIYYSHPATRGYSNSHPGLM